MLTKIYAEKALRMKRWSECYHRFEWNIMLLKKIVSCLAWPKENWEKFMHLKCGNELQTSKCRCRGLFAIITFFYCYAFPHTHTHSSSAHTILKAKHQFQNYVSIMPNWVLFRSNSLRNYLTWAHVYKSSFLLYFLTFSLAVLCALYGLAVLWSLGKAKRHYHLHRSTVTNHGIQTLSLSRFDRVCPFALACPPCISTNHENESKIMYEIKNSRYARSEYSSISWGKRVPSVVYAPAVTKKFIFLTKVIFNVLTTRKIKIKNEKSNNNESLSFCTFSPWNQKFIQLIF